MSLESFSNELEKLTDLSLVVHLNSSTSSQVNKHDQQRSKAGKQEVRTAIQENVKYLLTRLSPTPPALREASSITELVDLVNLRTTA